MNEWIVAAIVVGAAIVIGAVAARLVGGAVGRSTRPALAEAAGSVSSLVFSVVFIVGLVIALGVVQPDLLETIPADLVEFVPRVFAAAIVVIAGNIVSSLARTAAQRALRDGPAARYGPAATRATILAFAVILGAAQLGVDTTIINIAAAAVLFGAAATTALLVGLGGRVVAGEIAAARAWRNTLVAGDQIRVQGIEGGPIDGGIIDGVVVAIHPTSVEVDCDGRTLLVPNTQLLGVVVERVRAADG